MTLKTPRFASPCVVLDTNCLLDWLVFRNPVMDAVALAVTSKQLQWLACGRMREEFEHMLHHASLKNWCPDAQAALATFDQHAHLLADPTAGAPQRLVCSDPDDQIFIDLAVLHQARWLVTHDRALLKLAHRARRFGVAVVRPAEGCFEFGAAKE